MMGGHCRQRQTAPCAALPARELLSGYVVTKSYFATSPFETHAYRTAVLFNRSRLQLSHTRWIPAAAWISIYPLMRMKANQEQYELFPHELLDTYGPRDGHDAEQGDGGSVVRTDSDGTSIVGGWRICTVPAPVNARNGSLLGSSVNQALSLIH